MAGNQPRTLSDGSETVQRSAFKLLVREIFSSASTAHLLSSIMMYEKYDPLLSDAIECRFSPFSTIFVAKVPFYDLCGLRREVRAHMRAPPCRFGDFGTSTRRCARARVSRLVPRRGSSATYRAQMRPRAAPKTAQCPERTVPQFVPLISCSVPQTRAICNFGRRKSPLI